jgi:betaine-aldehyde dehydrogenase
MQPAYQSDRLFIGGEWVRPHSAERIEVRSPATEQVIGHVPAGSPEDIDKAVQAARRCFDHSGWPQLSFAERAQYLRRIAAEIDKDKDALAQATSDESGLPLVKSAGYHVRRSIELLNYYADMGDTFAQEQHRPGVRANVIVRHEPMGVVGVITPWNGPIPMAHFALAPALLAGCAVILKTAAESPLHGQLLAAAYQRVGLPAGALSIIPADREASEALVRHPSVDKISFTGSTATGKRVGAICAEQIKRVGLELGGKSAAIILDDADLAQTMPRLVAAALQNNCQACVGQTRILAPRSRYDEIVAAFCAGVDRLKLGDPRDPDTDIGPLISAKQRARAESYIALGLSEGAKIVRGGGRPVHLDRGWYVEPTVFRDVRNNMRVAQEEIFGPVFVIIPYEDDAAAIAIANDSAYGLSGTVWTADRDRGLAIARRVRTGNYGINTFMLELAAPFGGFKDSGIGRQLGPEGLGSYLELKAIHEPVAAH